MNRAAITEGRKLRDQVEHEFKQARYNIAAKLEEHHDSKAVAAEIVRHLGLGAEAQELERQRIQRSARATLDRESAEADLRLPPARDDYTLSAYLDEPREVRKERVEGMQRAGHKTLLVASYKTGKTTLHANLTRSLTEGSDFLGRFAVKRPEGRVGIWNAEMESEDFQDYLGNAGVTPAPLPGGPMGSASVQPSSALYEKWEGQ